MPSVSRSCRNQSTRPSSRAFKNGGCGVAVGSSARVSTTCQRLAFIAQDHPVTTSSAQLCETCRSLESCTPATRPRAEWAHLDVTTQHAADAVPALGLVLVALPPVAGTMTGQVELRLDDAPVGTATLTCCTSCRIGTLDYVQITAEHRRLGYGRTLVAVALVRASAYTWTAPVPTNPIAHAFRTRIDLPRTGLACPHRGP